MRIGYTLWKRSDFRNLPQLLNDGLSCGIDLWTVVLALKLDRHGLRFYGEPFMSVSEVMRTLNRLSAHNVQVITKVQVHPGDSLPQGLQPRWWGGYVTPDLVSPDLYCVVQDVFNKLMLRWAEFAKCDVYGTVIATEMAGMVNKIKPFTKLMRYSAPLLKGKAITYGANFWQPLLWKYQGWIWLARFFGIDKNVLKTIFAWNPIYSVPDNKLRWLSNLIWNAKLTQDTVKHLTHVGLSCYFYPSMVGDPDKAYDSYKFWFIDFSYPNVVREWCREFDKPLWVTECGVLYNAPIAKDKEEVKHWFKVTMDRFQFAKIFTVWEDTKTGWFFELLKELKL